MAALVIREQYVGPANGFAKSKKNTKGIPMDQLRDLLVDNLQDLLHAETQLIQALPKMAQAVHNPKLKQAIEKHLTQTQGHAERLNQAFELLGEKGQAKPCKGMKGIIDEGAETIEENEQLEELAADLALIAAAQKAEHYEIAGYGTARCLARQIGERDVAKLLSQTLGEEESADFLLTEIGKPLLQEALLADNSGTEETEAQPVKARAKAQRG
jgi:Mn-containing catalase